MHILSCGHECNDLSNTHAVSVKEYNRKGNRAISYMSVCEQCYKDYERMDLLLKTETDCDAYLDIEPCQHPEKSIWFDVYGGDGSGNDGDYVCGECGLRRKRFMGFSESN